eukprot:CAMPEP_0170344174 /NCGR_PEP_ID=MMETSP0116_2-20130129/73272_1 /TAXON_ID=400756 /ORGANISM="Durinskia baltica, Strain CSIRO CS-38" /LENGTH=93 /DNA_ID=CAMNT_0010597847 /DNA_START=50 /DNA_END=328 /DNA_ORIENTATION=-
MTMPSEMVILSRTPPRNIDDPHIFDFSTKLCFQPLHTMTKTNPNMNAREDRVKVPSVVGGRVDNCCACDSCMPYKDSLFLLAHILTTVGVLLS